MKDRWSKPQLIILARGTPEENVLNGCKTLQVTGGTPQVVQTGCRENGLYCGDCAAIVSS